MLEMVKKGAEFGVLGGTALVTAGSVVMIFCLILAVAEAVVKALSGHGSPEEGGEDE